MNVGKAREAIPHFDRAIRLNPRHAETYNNGGISGRKKGDMTAALADFDKAIELDPKYARAYGGRRLTRLLQGKEVETEKDFGRCFELDPTLRQIFELLIKEAKAKRAGKP